MAKLLWNLGCWTWALTSLSAQPAFERADHIPISHQSVYAIVQDSDGFLWFGTAAGLDRYDGYDILSFTHAPSQASSLPANLVTCLLEDAAGFLWVGTAGGLARINPSRQEVQRFRLNGDSPRVLTLFEAGGRLWVGAEDGLFTIETNGETRVTQHVAGLTAVGFQLRNERELAVLLAAPGRPLTVAIFDSLSAAQVRSMPAGEFTRTDGRDWDGDLHSVFTEPWPSHALGPHLVTSEQMWIGRQDGLQLRVDDVPSTVLLDDPTAYLSNFVRSLYRDRSGTIWAGTHGGLFRRDPSVKLFRRFTHAANDPASLSLSAVSAIAPLADGTLLVATFGGGLNLALPDRPGFQRLTDRDEVCSRVVWAIQPGSAGVVWLGTPQALCRFDPGSGRFVRFAWPRTRETGPNIRSIALDPSGRLILGTSEGLFRMDPRSGDVARLSTDPDHQSDTSIEGLFVESSGTIWAGTTRSTLARLTPDPAARSGFRTEGWGLPPGGEEIWTIHSSGGPQVWLGSALGLSLFDTGDEEFRHFGPAQGLPGSVVYSILEDDGGRLWLGTNQGLAACDWDGKVLACQAFPQATSPERAEFNRRAALRLPSGEMLFGSMEGLLRFDPTQLGTDRLAPPVVVTAVRIANRDTERRVVPPRGAPLDLSYSDYSLAFEFAALDFTSPEENLYRYQLVGFDPTPSRPTTRRFVQYTNLPPGRYTFQVRGANEDGVWNEAGASIALIVRPPFWATWWFRGGVVLLLLAIGAAAYRYRVARLLEMERLRLQVAGDLHDDLGSDLSGIALLSERLARRGSFEPSDRRHLQRIATSAQRMVEDLRDIVWLVDPSHDQVQDLAAKMHDFLQAVSGSLEVRFETRGLDSTTRLSLNARRQLFLVFKEALHNVIRHADAREVAVRFECHGQRLQLRIADDGRGIGETDHRNGHGLASMRRRAAAVGGTLQVESPARGGTVVTLEASVA